MESQKPRARFQRSSLRARHVVYRVAGLVLVLVSAAFTVFLATYVEVDVEDGRSIRESLKRVADDDVLYAISWFFNFVAGLLLVAAAGASYLVFRSYNRALAILGLAGLLAAGIAFAGATASFFGVFNLAKDFSVSGGSEAVALASTAKAMGLAGFVAWATGVTLVGGALVAIGGLILSAGVTPKWHGWWAALSGVLMLFGWLTVAPMPHEAEFVRDVAFGIVTTGGVGGLLFFLVLGGRLLLFGSLEVSVAGTDRAE